MILSDINVNFDFTEDTPNFWNGFWERANGLGAGGADPDAKSKTLREYHRLLWSRPLPNGETMELEDGRSRYYLRWKDIYFGSDSITATFRYYRNVKLLEEIKEQVGDYHAFVESYLRRLYTIGGTIILPSFVWCLNQARGCNKRICDRWDLTLECIRLFYLGKESPLNSSLEKSRHFFELFVDFKGFVDFFFLQDCVDESYEKVLMWLDTPLFITNPIPADVKTYIAFVQAQLDFVDKRNQRIQSFIDAAST